MRTSDGPGLVDDAPEQIEVEHAGLARPGDAGFRRAARLGARDVAGRRALDVQPRRQRPGVERPDRRRLVLLQRQLQRAVAAELRAAGVQVRRAACEIVGPVQTSCTDDVRASPSTRWPYGSAQPQTMRPSQSMTSVLHGQVHWKRVARKFSDTALTYFLVSFFMYASSLSFSYFTVLRNRLSAR